MPNFAEFCVNLSSAEFSGQYGYVWCRLKQVCVYSIGSYTVLVQYTIFRIPQHTSAVVVMLCCVKLTNETTLWRVWLLVLIYLAFASFVAEERHQQAVLAVLYHLSVDDKCKSMFTYTDCIPTVSKAGTLCLWKLNPPVFSLKYCS